MTLGKVTGTIVATKKDEKLIGGKLMVVQDVDLDGNVLEKYSVAVDAVGAGVGELVLTASGSSARITDATKDKPVDSVIMAIVDTLEVHGRILYQK